MPTENNAANVVRNDRESELAAHQDRISHGGFARAAILLLLSSLSLRLLSLGATSILARVLAPEDYGIVALAATVTGFLEVVTNVQVYGSLMRAKEITEAQLRTAFSINLMRGVGSAAVLYAISDQFATILGDVRLGPILTVLAIVPFLNGLQNPSYILFERKLQFLPEITRTLLANILGVVTSITVAIHYHSYWALVSSTLVTTFVHLVMTYWRSPLTIGLSLKHFGEMFRFGGWLTATSVVEYLTAKVDVIVVGRQMGPALLGGYQAGQQIVSTATWDVIGPLVRAIYPTFAMTDDVEELSDKYLQVQTLMLSLALPVGMGLSALSPEVVRILLGTQWSSAVPVVRFIAPILALQTMLASVDAIAMAQGKTHRLLHRTLIVFIVRILLLFVGFYLAGFMGIILARILSGVFYLVYGLRLAATLTRTNVWTPILNSWRSLCSVSVMFLLIELIGHHDMISGESAEQLLPSVLMRIAIGAITYVLTLYILWWLCKRPAGIETLLVNKIGKWFRQEID